MKPIPIRSVLKAAEDAKADRILRGDPIARAVRKAPRTPEKIALLRQECRDRRDRYPPTSTTVTDSKTGEVRTRVRFPYLEACLRASGER
jgi:hypothetical protein